VVVVVLATKAEYDDENEGDKRIEDRR